MTEEKNKVIRDEGGFFTDVGLRIKLIFRLMGDPRVNIFLKLLPIASLIYLIIPAPIPPDLIPLPIDDALIIWVATYLFVPIPPDLIPLPIDDALIIWVATYLFVELCPPIVVQEHMRALNMEIPGKWRDPSDEIDDENIIDAEFREEA
jgi:hypothetical protein